MNTPNRRLFVVIHTLSTEPAGIEHAIGQTELARGNGADGIIIIPDYAKAGHPQATTEEQLLYLEALKEQFPDFPIGVNFLTRLSGIEDHLYRIQPAFIQTDSAGFDSVDRTKLPQTEFFCGLAFKYSQYEDVRGEKLKIHSLRVTQVCDVPTTSGKATGVPADVEKIREIVSYLPEGKRLGIASGVSAENVHSYMQAGITDFLVATSLLLGVDIHNHDLLDPKKIADLARTIHA